MEDENSDLEEQQLIKGQPMTPVLVEYCPNCSMPYDFCDFGDKWETGVCFKECSTRYPEIFPIETVTFDNISLNSLSIKNKKKLPKEIPLQIVIQKSSRTHRKVITSVTGLHLFNVKLEVATKLFSKHFATGASIVKGASGQPDRVDIQGDVEEPLIELLINNFSGITEDKIVRLQPKLK